MDTEEKILITYYEAKIDHNHPNLHIVWETVKEERQDLRTSTDLLKNIISHINQSTFYLSQSNQDPKLYR